MPMMAESGSAPNESEDSFVAAEDLERDKVNEQWKEADYLEDADSHRRFMFFQAVPAWFISTIVHVLILLVLGLVTFADPKQVVNVMTAVPAGEDSLALEEFAIEQFATTDASVQEDIGDPVTDLADEIQLNEPSEIEPMDVETVVLELTDMAAEMAPESVSLQTLKSMSIQPLGSRTEDMKKKLLREYGGSQSSEAAVTKALKWLSDHQLKNGAWTFQHDVVCRGKCDNPGLPEFARSLNGATALALLPFLGAGQTHIQGEFKNQVFRGLRFLINNGRAGKKDGLAVLDFSDGGGRMYSHAIVAIALCEAYAMTEDPELLIPAQAALNFLVIAQGRDGGWRYSPNSIAGDTSVVGWGVMALKSGYLAHLNVPSRTIKGTSRFLNKVSSPNKATYGYDLPSESTLPGCTAIGLLCRMYNGWHKTHPSIKAGVQELSSIGVLKDDIYYNYYAAQVLRHHGGEEWDVFNNELREWLVESQSTAKGSKGSWHFSDSQRHRGPIEGGRLASTCFATMILEVYYRHMPLYAEKAAVDDFPL